MSRNFGELHGVDVSDEMIRLAQERFGASRSIHLHLTNGADLKPLPSDYFDFVYSYAVFQHIPSREVVLNYFDEIRRVLKVGGLARLQLNGLPPASTPPNTWEGVRFTRADVAGYARDHDFQLLVLEGEGTQYMSATWRKQPGHWRTNLKNPGAPSRVQRSGNAHTHEPFVSQSGRFAQVSFHMERLSPDCDLNDVRVTFDGAAGVPYCIGAPEPDDVHQLKVALPPGVRTGIIPVELEWLGRPLCPRVWLRVVPRGPVVPRVCSVSDGTNLLSGSRIESGIVKLVMEDVADATAVSAVADGLPMGGLESYSTDVLTGRFEFNFRLPAGLASGSHQIEVSSGPRRLPPVAIEVA